MAGITTWNKATVPAGTDPWNAVPDVKKAADTSGLVFGVANLTEQNGLAALAPGGVLPIPTLIFRADLGTYMSWDGTAWAQLPKVTSGAGVTDGFWTITGGLTKTVTAGLTQVTASLQLVRTTASITITVGDSALLVGLIPAGFRPTSNHYFSGTSNTDAGTRYAEPQLVIGNTGNGTLVGRSTSGGPVTLGVGYTLFISTSWFV